MDFIETVKALTVIVVSYVIARLIYFSVRDYVIHLFKSYLVKRQEMAEKRRKLERAKFRLKT